MAIVAASWGLWSEVGFFFFGYAGPQTLTDSSICGVFKLAVGVSHPILRVEGGLTNIMT